MNRTNQFDLFLPLVLYGGDSSRFPSCALLALYSTPPAPLFPPAPLLFQTLLCSRPLTLISLSLLPNYSRHLISFSCHHQSSLSSPVVVGLIPFLPSLQAMESDSMDFKLGELLKEVQLDDSTVEIVDLAVTSIVDAIKSIPEQPVRADDASRFIADLGVPSEKVSFTFRVPESIQVGGSHSISSVSKPDINVDLLVRMPKVRFFFYVFYFFS